MKENIQLLHFDQLELITVDEQKTNIPEHFHPTFCISLIERGVETIQMQEQVIYSEAGSISICNPYEIHANPIMDKDLKVAFKTIYPSQDLLDYFFGGKAIVFHNRQLQHPKIVELFRILVHQISTRETKEIETALSNFFTLLKVQYHQASPPNRQFLSAVWSELILYIDHHLTEKITLEQLARFVNMDKYHFSKLFRAKFGMSPMNYVLMQKIFTAKSLIQADTELTALAYEFEFSDQAHFSKTFKRFIGVSPRNYKRQRAV